MAKYKAPTTEQLVANLRAHANALFRMPASEQFIGARDATLHSALLDLAAWIESQAAAPARRGEDDCPACRDGECPTHLGTPSHLGARRGEDE
jgi:hypothetical protein